MILMFPNEAEPKGAVVANSSQSDFAASLRNALKTIDDSNEKSSEELTEKDLQELRTALEKELPKENVDKVINVFEKFRAGTSPETRIAGFVS